MIKLYNQSIDNSKRFVINKLLDESTDDKTIISLLKEFKNEILEKPEIKNIMIINGFIDSFKWNNLELRKKYKLPIEIMKKTIYGKDDIIDTIEVCVIYDSSQVPTAIIYNYYDLKIIKKID